MHNMVEIGSVKERVQLASNPDGLPYWLQFSLSEDASPEVRKALAFSSSNKPIVHLLAEDSHIVVRMAALQSRYLNIELMESVADARNELECLGLAANPCLTEKAANLLATNNKDYQIGLQLSKNEWAPLNSLIILAQLTTDQSTLRVLASREDLSEVGYLILVNTWNLHSTLIRNKAAGLTILEKIIEMRWPDSNTGTDDLVFEVLKSPLLNSNIIERLSSHKNKAISELTKEVIG